MLHWPSSGPGSGGTGEGSGHDGKFLQFVETFEWDLLLATGAPGVEQSQPPIIHAGAGGSGTAG